MNVKKKRSHKYPNIIGRRMISFKNICHFQGVVVGYFWMAICNAIPFAIPVEGFHCHSVIGSYR